MRPADAADAAALETVCLGTEAWSEKLLVEAVGRSDSIYLVARVDGRQVGHAGIRNICGEGEITNVCVDPGFRGRGIAGQLLDRLLREGRTRGIGDCTLEVRASNEAAIRLYKKAGFSSEGIRPGFYEAPADDALIMWLRG